MTDNEQLTLLAWVLEHLGVEIEACLPVVPGDYVLGTKWDDGDPGDHWGVGFYDRQENGRHFIVCDQGVQIRAGGFRKVGHITQEVGTWLLGVAVQLEMSPPGSVNLWTMLTPLKVTELPPDLLLRVEDELLTKKVRWTLKHSPHANKYIWMQGSLDERIEVGHKTRWIAAALALREEVEG